MKKVLLLFALFLCIGSLQAQVLFTDNLFQERMGDIKTTVVDSLTREPLAFASVYVVPAKDTTITNFTLTDADGAARLDEVPFGSYVFHVEMMGYKPFVKAMYLRERHADMDTVRLQLDEQFLQAAVVSAAGNPIVVKKDTIEINASSFRVGANAMLKDLLRRMPGMEITEDNQVKFNGERIDRLTVGGRTFFFNDQSMALDNLPAAVVEKIRVIDRESEGTRASGLQDGTREKVLDVGLKKEYEKGWFGNVGISGGGTLVPQEEDALRGGRRFLYGANALAAAYTEKDQVTVIGNARNVDNSLGLNQGIFSATQLGVNANTLRIKGVKTTVSANHKYSETESGMRSERTTYQEDGNLTASSDSRGKAYANKLSSFLELKKEEGRFWLNVVSGFRYGEGDDLGSGSATTFRGGEFLNRTDRSTRSHTANRAANFDTDLTFRELWGKKNRSIRLTLEADYSGVDGQSRESTFLATGQGETSRKMAYENEGSNLRLTEGLRYTEPFGEKWMLSSLAYFTWQRLGSVRDAFEEAVRNDYLSSLTRSSSLKQEYELTAQYQAGENGWLTIGGHLTGLLNETYSKSFGIEETTGEEEWNWFLTPMLRFQHTRGNDRLTVSASGYGRQPSPVQMRTALNISDPSRLNVGNIYLKPSSQTSFNADWTRSNREKFATWMVSLGGQVHNKPVTSAQWYDAAGIQYSVPVNTRVPGLSTGLSTSYTAALDARKSWTLMFNASAAYSTSTSYQTRTALPELDPETFDYATFMAGFWGDAAGDRFYGGASGFEESRTRTLNPSAGISVKKNHDICSFSVSASSTGRLARYSLDPRANLNTLDTYLSARVNGTTRRGFDLETDLAYVFYSGYPAGYGQPEWRWNAEVVKAVGPFSLSISLHDILNQTRNLTHAVTANYEEDTYRLVMGRYILFGVKWNFGKMNAIQSARAQEAAWRMAF
ncbi:MAG: outer membrane beta-barrel protein [Bacteroidales bacterium]|nr:outer membrane beta-barrel protein [Bacteroidales bacterium]